MKKTTEYKNSERVRVDFSDEERSSVRDFVKENGYFILEGSTTRSNTVILIRSTPLGLKKK